MSSSITTSEAVAPARSHAFRASSDFLEREFLDGFACRLGLALDFGQSAACPPEVFSTLLVTELVHDRLSPAWGRAAAEYMARRREPSGWVYFWDDHALPKDVDSTSLLIAALAKLGAIGREQYHRSLSCILSNRASNGVIQVYCDPGGSRDGITDAVVAANALFAANLGGRVDEARPTEAYVFEALKPDALAAGTRYYHSPETLLLFTARLVAAFPNRYRHWVPWIEAGLLQTRDTAPGTLELAQWTIAADLLNVLPVAVDAAREMLLDQRRLDGTWGAQALYKYGRKNVYFGSSVLSTAFVLRACLGRTAAHVRVPVIHSPFPPTAGEQCARS